MRILFVGDVYGRSGRDALHKHLDDLKSEFSLDVVIVNGENSANGRGITRKIADDFYGWGVDCITTGNHIWSQKDIVFSVDQDKKLIRPINYPKDTPGHGFYIHTIASGRKILIANVMGRLFMDALDDPFAAVKELLSQYRLGKNIDAIFIDFHAEATSEKMAFGHFVDGQVSAVIGTHTHVPTADTHIMKGGSAYQTDAGMTGDYDSVVGAKKDVPIARFAKKMSFDRLSPADGEGTFCGVFIETDDKTGLATTITPIRRGGVLQQA